MFLDRAAFWQRVQAALQTKSKPRISNIPGWLSPRIKAEAQGKQGETMRNRLVQK